MKDLLGEELFKEWAREDIYPQAKAECLFYVFLYVLALFDFILLGVLPF